MRTAILSIALAAMVPAMAFAQECPNDRYLFVGEALPIDPDLKSIAYFPEGNGPSVPVVFEGWRGNAMEWHVAAEYTCTNGIVVCSVAIPLANGETVDASETTIMDGKAPLYMVLSDLAQSTYSVQSMGDAPTTIKAQWPEGAPESDSPDEPSIVLPSIWKASGCAKP